MELPYVTHFSRVSSLFSLRAPAGNSMWRRATGMAGDSQISTDFSPADKPPKRTSVAPAAYEAVARDLPANAQVKAAVFGQRLTAND